MSVLKYNPKAPAAIWSTRVALFAVVLILTVLVLHRFSGLGTGMLLNALTFGFALCVLAIVLGIAAIVHIWRAGVSGGVPATFGILLSLLVFIWPASLIATYRELPVIHDITTDPVNPPAYLVLSNARREDANSAQYPGESTARQQEQYYPLVKPILIERSVEEAFELARSSMARLKWSIVAKVPPKKRGRQNKTARLEAVDKTLILGFSDDIVVRITGNNSSARIDIRSSSRYGRHDFGANATRIESFARMFKARMEATVAIAAEHEAARVGSKKKAKRPTAAQRRKARQRQERRRRKRRRRRLQNRG